ncbi:MAG: LytR C-terminal domain-containing protein [bacterium]
MTSKKILTIIYLNRSIALSKVSFSGKTANVSNYSEFALPEGTIENSIVYDPRTVSGIVKEYINAVGFKQIDKTVACIPDNKTKIVFYKYNPDLTELQNEEELTNHVESEMNTSMSQLSVIADTFSVRGITYTVVFAIRREILDPYITSSRFGASIFPASTVLSQALYKNIPENTIVLYPRGTSLRFFIWVDGHVIANSVDGKNVLEIDNNLAYGIREIILHGESLVGQPIKNVLFIEGKKVLRQDIESYMVDDTGFNVDFFRTKDATLDQYKFLALKGLIKKINDTGLEKPSIKRRMLSEKKNNQVAHEHNPAKIAILVSAIVVLVLGLIIAVGWTYYNENQRSKTKTDTVAQQSTPVPTPTAVIDKLNLTPTPMPTVKPTVVATTLPVVATVTPQQTTTQVLNGTAITGQAREVANILAAIGFTDIKTGDKPPYNTAKTLVNFMPGYEAMADQIIAKLQTKFPMITKQLVQTQDYSIIVITGTK